jgi:hypothetical protein
LKGDEIPAADHVALHCQPSDLEFDSLGAPNGLKIDAFRIDEDEDGISVNWIEYERGPFDQCLARTCRLIASISDVKASHRCAVMNVGEIRQTGVIRQRELKVVHDPTDGPPPNPAHSLICGVTAQDDDLLHDLTLLADLRPFGARPWKFPASGERLERRPHDAPLRAATSCGLGLPDGKTRPQKKAGSSRLHRSTPQGAVGSTGEFYPMAACEGLADVATPKLELG